MENSYSNIIIPTQCQVINEAATSLILVGDQIFMLTFKIRTKKLSFKIGGPKIRKYQNR
jgi:hypothetical protein